MRLFPVLLAALVLAAPAAAAPSFGVWDLQSDLAPASHNAYGDVQPKPRAALHHGTVVQCGTWCRFGSGWLAFRVAPRLAAADVASARVRASKRLGWTVELKLEPAAWTRWQGFAKRLSADAKRRGVPDVLVVAAGGQIAAAPVASQIVTAKGVVTLTGFSKASAKATAANLP